jgi:ribose-phosphate pyrophosphokinase
MTTESNDRLVLGFPSYREPAMRLAHTMATRFAEIDIHRFPDGESLVRLPEAMPRHVIFCCTLDRPNDKLVELELAAVTAKSMGVERLTLVAPYLCYMRQDTAFRPGEAVSQRIVGAWLARHFDTLVSVDPHLHRTHDLAQAVPVRKAMNLSAAPALAARVSGLPDQPILIGPDAESEQWVSAIAAPGKLRYGVATKRRLGDRDVRVELPGLDVRGRHVVLVDDVVSTGQTLIAAANQLTGRGASRISVLVTHALFVDDALSQLEDSGVTEVCSTDSVLHETNRIHLDGLLAEALSMV